MCNLDRVVRISLILPWPPFWSIMFCSFFCIRRMGCSFASKWLSRPILVSKTTRFAFLQQKALSAGRDCCFIVVLLLNRRRCEFDITFPVEGFLTHWHYSATQLHWQSCLLEILMRTVQVLFILIFIAFSIAFSSTNSKLLLLNWPLTVMRFPFAMLSKLLSILDLKKQNVLIQDFCHDYQRKAVKDMTSAYSYSHKVWHHRRHRK